MNDIFERIKTLCATNETSITTLCKEITGSPGNLSTWKKGNFNAVSLAAIATKFNVSVDYLLGRTEKEATAFTNVEYQAQTNGTKPFCPFMSTAGAPYVCDSKCALSIPTVEPPYVMCSIRLIAGHMTGEYDEDTNASD